MTRPWPYIKCKVCGKPTIDEGNYCSDECLEIAEPSATAKELAEEIWSHADDWAMPKDGLEVLLQSALDSARQAERDKLADVLAFGSRIPHKTYAHPRMSAAKSGYILCEDDCLRCAWDAALSKLREEGKP